MPTLSLVLTPSPIFCLSLPSHSLPLAFTLALTLTIRDRTGLPISELLPLCHARALTELRSAQAFVQLSLHLRQSLVAEQHEAFNRLFCYTLTSSIRGTLEANVDYSQGTGLAQVMRHRGVCNMQILADALPYGLVQPHQATDIVDLLITKLELQSPGQQDLRLLLLGHLLSDMSPVRGLAAVPRKKIAALLEGGCPSTETRSALERLLTVCGPGCDGQPGPIQCIM